VSWSIDIKAIEDAIITSLEDALPDAEIKTADSWLALQAGGTQPNPPSVFLVHDGGEPEEVASTETTVAGFINLRWRILLVAESYRGEAYRRTETSGGAYDLIQRTIGAVIGNNLGLAGIMQGTLNSYSELYEISGSMTVYEIVCEWRAIWSDTP
jgi:hypothetical protein